MLGDKWRVLCTFYFASFRRVNHKFWCHLEYAGQSTAILEVKASFTVGCTVTQFSGIFHGLS